MNYTIERFLSDNATIKHIPINAILELTPLCNLNCDMCYVRLDKTAVNKMGGLRSVDEWITWAEEMQQAGTLFTLLTGGEPLLYPEFQKLYLHLKKLGMIITINTNGTLIDEAWADFFAVNRPRRINITLYGKDSNTYDKLCHCSKGFQQTIRAIQLLKSKNIDVKINGSITPSNMQDSFQLLRIAERLKVPIKIDTYMYPASREKSHCFNEAARLNPSLAAKIRTLLMKQQNEDFTDRAKDFVTKAENTAPGIKQETQSTCRAGRSSFAINWQGYMRPCILVTKPEVPVFSNGFISAWNQITEKTAQIYLSSKCNTCTLRNVCQTCAACAFLETGKYNGTPDYMCQYTQQTLKFLKEYL